MSVSSSSDSDSDLKSRFNDVEESEEEEKIDFIHPFFDKKNKKFYEEQKKYFNFYKKKQEEKKNEIEEYDKLIKCYICFNPSNNPVICRYCGNIACKNCFYKWINNHYNCGCCRKNITIKDLISPPIINKINEFLKDIQNKSKIDQCLEHKEKFLYFCVNCSKKYCGKCLYFNSEESKKHSGHKIFDYSEVKKSKYNELFNQLVVANETDMKINENSKIYDNYILENKIKYENANFALNEFKNIIQNKYKEKNNLISENQKQLFNTKNEINDICKNITNNLKKIENFEKSIENFNPQKNCEKLGNKLEIVKNLENKIEKNQIINNELNFNIFNFEIKITKKEILKSINKSIVIKVPIYIEIQLEKESNFSIIIYKEDSIKKEVYLYPILKLKNEIYQFKRIIVKDINNSMEENNDENGNIINNDIYDDYYKYKLFINLNKLDDGENIFKFIIHKISIF